MLWVRQLYEFPYGAKHSQSRLLPHPLTREPPPGRGLWLVRTLRATTLVGEDSISSRLDEKLLFQKLFHSHSREVRRAIRRRTPEPALCKGRCRVKRGGGVVPDRNYLSFLLCKLHTFTIPQALSRQPPLHKGAFFSLCEQCEKHLTHRRWCQPPPGRGLFVCANIAGMYLAPLRGDHWSPAFPTQIQHRRGAFHMPPLAGNSIPQSGGEHPILFSKVFAGVRGRLFQKAPPSLSPARTMSPGAASCGRRV